MITYLREPVVHNAFYKKYAGKKFLKGKPHHENNIATDANDT